MQLVNCLLTSYSTEGQDFALTSSSHNFSTGAQNTNSVDIIVTPIEDFLVEGTESYVLSIEMLAGPAQIGPVDTDIVNIQDNDGKLMM